MIRFKPNKEVLEDLLSQGLTQNEIGKKLFYSKCSIKNYMKKYNLSPNYPCKAKYNLADEPILINPKINTIRHLRLEGKTWKQIGEHMNLNMQFCIRILTEAYNAKYVGKSCMRWDEAIKGLSPRAINLLEKYGSCKSD